MRVTKAFRYMLTCTDCALHKTRTNVVVGDGLSKKARWMLIGEAPGANEDEEGLPFVGAAGRRLNKLLADAGLSRKDFYITNIVKCRPPENRVPSGREVKACSKHLKFQLSVIQPELLVVVGNTSLQYFLPRMKIMSCHGQILLTRNGKRIYPIIHPAAALRDPSYNELIERDLERLASNDFNSHLNTPVFGPRTTV